MNVFFEFHKIVKGLQEQKVSYALIGGVAMAYYSNARFTKDIDILLKKTEFNKIKNILENEKYVDSEKPWTFKDSSLTLHRFWKVLDGDDMIIDILIAEDDKHNRIIDDALEAFSKETGVVRVADKEDLIWLKEQRNSKLDQADIDKLKNE